MIAVTVTTLEHLTAPLWAEIFASLKRSAASALDAARAVDKAGKPEVAQHFANIGALELEYAASARGRDRRGPAMAH